MQYINKQNVEPIDWNDWFTVPPSRRSYDYRNDRDALPNVSKARNFLIEEQYSLCAYCQQLINLENSSIEHLLPKEFNVALSTSYFNLVAVCNKNQVKDKITKKFHCDRSRGSTPIIELIHYSNAESTSTRTNAFFGALSNGEIIAKKNLKPVVKNQVQSFIEVLNLNHSILMEKRAKDTLRGLISAYNILDRTSPQRETFWRIQYERILKNRSHPFREYLLIYIGSKIGLS